MEVDLEMRWGFRGGRAGSGDTSSPLVPEVWILLCLC